MKNQERAKNGKFKKAEDRAAVEPVEVEEQPKLLTKVSGQNTKMAKLQSHNLKTDEIGEPLPEFIEGVEENEG